MLVAQVQVAPRLFNWTTCRAEENVMDVHAAIFKNHRLAVVRATTKGSRVRWKISRQTPSAAFVRPPSRSDDAVDEVQRKARSGGVWREHRLSSAVRAGCRAAAGGNTKNSCRAARMRLGAGNVSAECTQASSNARSVRRGQPRTMTVPTDDYFTHYIDRHRQCEWIGPKFTRSEHA